MQPSAARLICRLDAGRAIKDRVFLTDEVHPRPLHQPGGGRVENVGDSIDPPNVAIIEKPADHRGDRRRAMPCAARGGRKRDADLGLGFIYRNANPNIADQRIVRRARDGDLVPLTRRGDRPLSDGGDKTRGAFVAHPLPALKTPGFLIPPIGLKRGEVSCPKPAEANRPRLKRKPVRHLSAGGEVVGTPADGAPATESRPGVTS